MTTMTAIMLFLSWAASTFIGLGIGMAYAVHSDRQILKALSEAIVRVEMGDE
jgi:hypothetical protein